MAKSHVGAAKKTDVNQEFTKFNKILIKKEKRKRVFSHLKKLIEISDFLVYKCFFYIKYT